MIRLLLTIPCLILLTSTSANAAVILSNDFDGVTTNVNPYSTGQVVAPLVVSNGVARVGYTAYGGNGNGALRAAEYRTFTDAPNVLGFTRFFEFNLAPVGAEIDFDSFVYAGFEELASGATVGASKFAFRSSLDSFATNIGSANLTGTTIDLSGAAFQDITSEIQFRLYIQSEDGAGTSPDSIYNLDSFAFNGTVTAVPEPASFAFLTLCAVAVGARRRKVSARNSSS